MGGDQLPFINLVEEEDQHSHAAPTRLCTQQENQPKATSHMKSQADDISNQSNMRRRADDISNLEQGRNSKRAKVTQEFSEGSENDSILGWGRGWMSSVPFPRNAMPFTFPDLWPSRQIAANDRELASSRRNSRPFSCELNEWENIADELKKVQLVRKHLDNYDHSGAKDTILTPKAVLAALREYGKTFSKLQGANSTLTYEIGRLEQDIGKLKEFFSRVGQHWEQMERVSEHSNKVEENFIECKKRCNNYEEKTKHLFEQLSQEKDEATGLKMRISELEKACKALQEEKKTQEENSARKELWITELHQKVHALELDFRSSEKEKAGLAELIEREKSANVQAQKQIQDLKSDFAKTHNIENQVSDSEICRMMAELQQGISDLADDLASKNVLSLCDENFDPTRVNNQHDLLRGSQPDSDFVAAALQSVVWHGMEEIFELSNSCGFSENGLIGQARDFLRCLRIDGTNIDIPTKEWVRKLTHHLKQNDEQDWAKAKTALADRVQAYTRSQLMNIGVTAFDEGHLNVLRCMIDDASSLATTLHKQQTPFVFSQNLIRNRIFKPEIMEQMILIERNKTKVEQQVRCIVIPVLAKLKEVDRGVTWVVVQKAKVVCSTSQNMETSVANTQHDLNVASARMNNADS